MREPASAGSLFLSPARRRLKEKLDVQCVASIITPMSNSTHQVGESVYVLETGEIAKVRSIQVDPITGHVFYRLEIWPDTPDRIFHTVGASQIAAHTQFEVVDDGVGGFALHIEGVLHDTYETKRAAWLAFGKFLNERV